MDLHEVTQTMIYKHVKTYTGTTKSDFFKAREYNITCNIPHNVQTERVKTIV